ncbi:phosphoglycerate mutase-like protein [Dacryopinax primogenitus]|uniref:Phosphoglycerate mutase-like protein n=1 Tax=Dacryopinax primogenitus (strain DJM 731) TaxID=1858805 RepID=M5FQU4_DACPD|nr:phosphoglycerate mutase-like protein [Dacryopinax primogenitus]EJT99345.1 phosphoglycerate mutase-like protein [Dacryopinax primogenitus]
MATVQRTAAEDSKMALDVDAYEYAPSDLRLEQLHVYVRHGERTPVHPRLAEYIPPLWPLCRTSFLTYANILQRRPDPRAEVLSPLGKDWHGVGLVKMERVAEVPRGRDEAGHEFDGMEHACGFGQLTDKGVVSTSLFGSSLRALYVDKLGFLPPFYLPESAYFRSTDMPRTIATLQHIISHLYPPWQHPAGELAAPSPRILVRFQADEDLMQNMTCERFRLFREVWAKAVEPHIDEQLKVLDEKLSKYIDGRPVRLNGHPKLSGLLDTVKSAHAHGIPVPPEFREPEVMRLMESAVVAEWFGGYRHPEIRTLGSGRVFSDLQKVMSTKIASPSDPIKLRILSTHDTTLATMLISMGVFDGKWPDFTSSIIFELFRRDEGRRLFSSAKPQYYVRARYQNRSLSLPACAPVGAHYPNRPELCTFQAFSSLVATMTPKNWRQQCLLPLGEEDYNVLEGRGVGGQIMFEVTEDRKTGMGMPERDGR